MNTINQKNKAQFMLPGFYEHFKFYQFLNNFLNNYPEAKYEWAEIYCYYGNIPFCIWDGGRIFKEYYPATVEEMRKIASFYSDKKVRLVFTNNLLQPIHCADKYNNIVLSIFNSSNNEIVLNSDTLEHYIINNYPDYSLISSTTKCLDTISTKKELNKSQYKYICLDYNLNHNWEFLNELTPEEKEKTEFLVNPICGPGCQFRQEHYRANSVFSLNYGKPYILKSCEITEPSICPVYNPNIISAKEIKDIYLLNNFQYFKIEGRSLTTMDVALACAEYLIKPEFHQLFLRNAYYLL